MHFLHGNPNLSRPPLSKTLLFEWPRFSPFFDMIITNRIRSTWITGLLFIAGLTTPPLHSETPPSPSFIVGGELLETDFNLAHPDPHFTLTWEFSDSFISTRPGFWSSFRQAVTDWSLSTEEFSEPDYRFRVEQAREGSFAEPRLIYEGLDLSSVLSGMEEGLHFFRVQTFFPETGETSAWSPILTLDISYPPLGRALGIFTVGLLVSGITIVTILVGTVRMNRQNQQEDA